MIEAKQKKKKLLAFETWWTLKISWTEYVTKSQRNK